MPIQTFFMDSASLDTRQLLGPPSTSLLDDCENVEVSAEGDLIGRRGFQHKISQIGGYGLCRYIYANSSSTLVDELITIDTSIYRVLEGYITIAYSGAATHITVTVLVESGVFRLKVLSGASTLLNRSLGQGFEESSVDTVTATVAAIDALASITCTVTGDGAVPSAFLDVTQSLHIPSGQSKTIKFRYAVAVNETMTQPLQGLLASKTTSLLRNVKTTTLNNLLFLADGKSLHTYDGQTLVKSGLPVPPAPTASRLVGTHDTDVSYYVSYEYTDARGRHTESEFSDPLELNLSRENASLTLRTLEAGSGYNTGCAIVNGTQAVAVSSGTVTLNVNNGLGGAHTLRAGDSAMLLNRATSEITSYVVSSVTSSTVVLTSSEAINVTSGDVISNSLLINLYKAVGTEATKYLVKSLPNNSFENSIQYTDAPATAIVNGNQIAVSSNGRVLLTVDSGSGILAGDVVTLYNYSTEILANVDLEVVSLSGTQLLLISEQDIEVLDNDEIVVSRLTYPAFSEYVKTQGPPPEADFCEAYKGNLVLAKNFSLYYSDEVNNGTITSVQSFPPSHLIQFSSDIVALYALGNYLYVFTKLTIEALVSAGLDVAPANRILVSDRVTASSQSGMVSIGETLYFVSSSGIYELTQGQLNQVPLSDPISSVFAGINPNVTNVLNLGRSVAAHDSGNRKLLFYIPEESSSNTDFALANSLTLVYDYYRQSWYFWKNWHMGGGALWNDVFYFSERKSGASLRRNIKKALKTYSDYDYLDHVSNIAVQGTLKWSVLGSQALGLQKKLRSISVFSRQLANENRPSQPTLSLRVYRDLVDNLLHTSSSIVFDTPGAKWNEFLWNDEPIGSWQKPHKKIKALSQVVEAVKIKFSAELSANNFNISAFEMDWEYLDQNILKT